MNEPKYIITNEGVGNAIVSVSNLKTVKKEFPGGKITKDVWGGKKMNGSALLTNGESMPITMRVPKQIAKTYIIEKEGISFYFDFNDTLSEITTWGKGNFQTDKGIIVGKSTFADLDSLYGKSDWEIVQSRLVKSNDNLIFYATDSIQLSPEANNITYKEKELIIEEIEIVMD